MKKLITIIFALFASMAVSAQAVEKAIGFSLSAAGIDTGVTDDIDNNGTTTTNKDISNDIAIGSLFFDFTFRIEYLPNLFTSSIFLTVAYIFSVLTIYYAPLSLTASSRYSVIVFGIIFGYLILNEIPSLSMIIGATIISLSGIFVIQREKELGKIE